MMKDIECPYCGKWQNICQDDQFGTKPDFLYENECVFCNKIFVFTMDWDPTYYPRKADCLNGGAHNYKPYKDPYGQWPDRKKCKDCENIVMGKIVEGAYEKWMAEVRASQDRKAILRRQEAINHA